MQANVVIKTGAAAEERSPLVLVFNRILILLTGMLIFFPQFNPGRITLKINENTSLFTTALSYSTITDSLGRALRSGWVESWHFYLLMAGCAVLMLGIVLCAVGGCMSLGNHRMRRVGLLFPMGGAVSMGAGIVMILLAHNAMSACAEAAGKLDKIEPVLPLGLWVFGALGVLILLTAIVSRALTKPVDTEVKMEMPEKFRLFLMFLPVLLLTFVFSYLPIYGWRFAFFDYKIGDALTADNFVGLKWFSYLFQNAATTRDMLRVLRNTLIMSGLGIATSWLPVAFAIFLAEIRSSKFQRFVQTFTTIPNFISWVLVYSFALAIFSTDGFINNFLRNVMGLVGANTDHLANADMIWVKMLLWGQWKGLGWSAIIYIAGISGIDQQLYEAAKVDGANRFHCMWHITVPGLMPTYCVMLLMSIAGILSNGMEQYLVFENPINKDVIEVLDLYVYNIGIKQGLIPLSTVVGIAKSIVGVTLLFGANGISKLVRGESII